MRRSWFACVVVLAAVATSLSPMPGRADAGALPVVGVGFHALWRYNPDDPNDLNGYTPEQRQYVVNELQAAGVGWVRIDIGWASVETYQKGPPYEEWYLDQLADAITRANAAGLKVLGTVWGTPCWAIDPTPPDCQPTDDQYMNYPPADPRGYADVAAMLAARFDGGPSGRIDAWEAWNEPDLPYFFDPAETDPQVRAKDYVDDVLLPAFGCPDAPNGFQAGNPRSIAVLGGPTYEPARIESEPAQPDEEWWINYVYDWLGKDGTACPPSQHFEVMAVHPYLAPLDLPPEVPDQDGTNIYLLSHVATVRAVMASYGDGSKDIWFTEFGWSSHTNSGSEVGNWECGVSPEQQGRLVVRALEMMRQNDWYDLYRVRVAFWYDDRNWNVGQPDPNVDQIKDNNFGLFGLPSSQGATTFPEKPSYLWLKGYLRAGVMPPEQDSTMAPSGEAIPDLLAPGHATQLPSALWTTNPVITEQDYCRANVYVKVVNDTGTTKTIQYRTVDLTAHGTTYGVGSGDVDYELTSGQMTVQPREIGTITIPVVPDLCLEPPEAFYLRYGVTPGDLGQGQATITILDDDTRPC